MKFQTLICTGMVVISFNLGFSQNRIDILYDASGTRISKKATGNMPNFKVDAFINELGHGKKLCNFFPFTVKGIFYHQKLATQNEKNISYYSNLWSLY
jgi:hypothetical protein